MAVSRWIKQRKADWQRLALLLKKHHQLIQTSSGGVEISKNILDVATIYKNTLTDLSRSRSSDTHKYLENDLNQLTLNAHTVVYQNPPAKFKDLRYFFLVQFPQTFRKNWLFFVWSTLMFVIGSVVAMIVVHQDPSTASYFFPESILDNLSEGKLWMEKTEAAPSESAFLMQNNIRVAFNAFAGGILLGVGSLLIMFYNGMYAFGGPLQVCIEYGVGDKLLTFVAAHGVIELTTIFISGAAGLMVGWQVLFPGNLERWTAVRKKGKEALVLIAGCVPLLVIAGLIEGLISLNQAVPLVERLLVSGFTLLGLINYLWFMGREEPAKK